MMSSLLVLPLPSSRLQAAAQPPAPAPDYSKPDSWLCLPGRTDICSTPLRRPRSTPTAMARPAVSPVAKDPSVDCFYVYPTVCRDRGMNSDLIPDDGEERARSHSQFARFCRRLPDLRADLSPDDRRRGHRRRRRRRRIKAAVASPIATSAPPGRNISPSITRGGPSCWSATARARWMLQQLIANEIEGKPDAGQMKLAIIPGFNLLVPQGKLVGGTFKSTPVCSKPGQTGCVMTWVSFRERNVPPAGAIFGVADAARHDRRLHQPGAARRDRLGEARQLLGRALDAAGPRRADQLVDAKARRRRPSSAPKAWPPPAASATGRAAICRSAPMPTPTTSAPTASAAKSAILGMFLPGLGHAPRRHAGGDGRSRPRYGSKSLRPAAQRR